MRGAVWLTLGGHRVGVSPRRRHPRGGARLRERICGRIYRDEQGVLTVPLLVLLMACALLGLGTLGLMRHWRHLTELQLRLDRCVGTAALDLKKTLERIEAGNTRLKALRAAQAAATLVEAAGSLVPLMEAEATHQQLEILRWRARQAEWLALRGCDGKADLRALAIDALDAASAGLDRPAASELVRGRTAAPAGAGPLAARGGSGRRGRRFDWIGFLESVLDFPGERPRIAPGKH